MLGLDGAVTARPQALPQAQSRAQGARSSSTSQPLPRERGARCSPNKHASPRPWPAFAFLRPRSALRNHSPCGFGPGARFSGEGRWLGFSVGGPGSERSRWGPSGWGSMLWPGSRDRLFTRIRFPWCSPAGRERLGVKQLMFLRSGLGRGPSQQVSGVSGFPAPHFGPQEAPLPAL